MASGLLIGVISAVAYLRISPLGVTAEIGSTVRSTGTTLGILPTTLYGLDTLRGCISEIRTATLSPNGLFVGGIVAGSLAAAMLAASFP